MGALRVVPDFLPSPEELSLKTMNTKVTLSLSVDSVAWFKEMGEKHHIPYQRMIRMLLDEYVSRQRSGEGDA
jgi:predicted DNA binding CopG/RHH family protein